ncbi:hypothetical protein [Nocardioides sp. LHG3406-4]|uniref:hypothetical protein n=1 Tax=Nocardioides sp. LHG3406-4 TaxID=2804575 RepID=UPI003CF89736
MAERLEARGEALRAQARELHTRSETVEWASVAADRMRARARDRRDELHAVADAYDEAGARVRAHADRVQHLLDLIATIEKQAHAIIASALDRADAAVEAVIGGIKDALSGGDEADRAIAQTPTPPPGHRDWLDMPALLPGIRT